MLNWNWKIHQSSWNHFGSKKTFKIFSFVKLACPIGFYGQDCSEKCNDTCAGCNHVSGVCDSGCVSGWMGHSCNQSIVFTSYWINNNNNQIHDSYKSWTVYKKWPKKTPNNSILKKNTFFNYIICTILVKLNALFIKTVLLYTFVSVVRNNRYIHILLQVQYVLKYI